MKVDTINNYSASSYHRFLSAGRHPYSLSLVRDRLARGLLRRHRSLVRPGWPCSNWRKRNTYTTYREVEWVGADLDIKIPNRSLTTLTLLHPSLSFLVILHFASDLITLL